MTARGLNSILWGYQRGDGRFKRTVNAVWLLTFAFDSFVSYFLIFDFSFFVFDDVCGKMFCERHCSFE